MVSDEVRRGITNARINEDNANIVFAELFLLMSPSAFIHSLGFGLARHLSVLWSPFLFRF